MFGSKGKEANVTVLPAGSFWPFESDITARTRWSTILPDLKNERRQFKNKTLLPPSKKKTQRTALQSIPLSY